MDTPWPATDARDSPAPHSGKDLIATLLMRSPSGIRHFSLSILLVLLGGLGALALRDLLSGANVGLVFIPVVLASALFCDLPGAVFGCLGSAICYNLLFLPPLYTFTPRDPDNILVCLVFISVTIVVRLIIRRMRVEADKARQVDKIAERERLQAALLAAISHDLRTPLAAILGSASSLKFCAGALDEAATLSLADTIQDEANRLNRLIANLLDMTRLEAGAMQPRTDLIDLADIFGSALRRVEPLLGRKRVRLALAPDLPDLQLDAVLFEQVLFNLLDNAAKYAPEHSEVEISAWRRGGEVIITVADAGAGLPDHQLERIFEKFHRAVPAGGPPGTGLGLAICRGFVEALGGSIRAGNQPPGGAIFTITLPILAGAAGA